MPEQPRSERRREIRKAVSTGATPPGPGLMGRLDVLIVLLLAAAIGGSVVGIALFSGGDDDGGDSAASPSPTQAPVFSPSSADELAIAALAQRSVEALPQGEWPSLYDAFVPEFQQRCPRDEF